MVKRKEYTPEYKTKLIIEILKEEKTISEIASRENINVKQLGNWKAEFLANASRAFSRNRDEKEVARQVAALEDKEKKYQAKVGQLTLEVDFLKETAQKMLGPGWEDQLGYKK
jgi:transposase-like protein